jgi:hypothetical protein
VAILKAEFGSIVISIYRGGAANAQHVRRLQAGHRLSPHCLLSMNDCCVFVQHPEPYHLSSASYDMMLKLAVYDLTMIWAGTDIVQRHRTAYQTPDYLVIPCATCVWS